MLDMYGKNEPEGIDRLACPHRVAWPLQAYWAGWTVTLIQ